MKAYVGSFAQPTSTGSQAITGLGFQPKLIIFFPSGLTADGSGSGLLLGWGAANGSQNIAVSYISRHGISPTSVRQVGSSTRCIIIADPAGGTSAVAIANFTSLDADGFTINWATVDATARIINFIALGGADLENSKIATITTPGGTGSQAYTGIGFQPNALIAFSSRSNETANAEGGALQFSFGNSAADQKTLGLKAKQNNPTSDTSHIQTVQEFYYLLIPNQFKQVYAVADLTSLDADGFTLNWTQTFGGVVLPYIAIKTANSTYFKLGQFDRPTSTGNQSVTGVGFKPAALLFFSTNNGNSTITHDHGRISLGAAGDLVSRRFAIGVDDEHNQNPTDAAQYLDRTKVVKLVTTSGGVASVTNEADMVSFDADGFTVNWSTVDGTANKTLFYLAFGPSEVVGSAGYYYGLINGGR